MNTHITRKAEIQGIFAEGGARYMNNYPTCHQQRKAIFSIINCRGPLLGKHIDKCDHCGHLEISYNSCRNRHCPKCQAGKQEQWINQLQGSLPPVKYFHLVFTLPHLLNNMIYQYQKDCYNILLKASAQTLLQVALAPGFLGAKTGCLVVLHTWGQNLQFHPHVHMLVPAGGMSEDGMEWIAAGKKFFAPVKVLSRVFRAKFLNMLEEFIVKRNIPYKVSDLKYRLYKIDWVVYAKKSFTGPAQVLNYLGRYTHRVAISNARIIEHRNGKVTFRWKDYRHKAIWKTMQLDTLEFIRRYLLHVLPNNFYKIRYYGLLALANRKQTIQRCLFLLKQKFHRFTDNLIQPETLKYQSRFRICPACYRGSLKFFALIPLCNVSLT